jgi:hypothetical protein
MLARINFLLGLGLLIQITLYFAFVYLLIPPLTAVAPDWVKPAAGIAVLAGVGATVQLLSMAMSSLRGVALYGKGERTGVLVFISQGAMIFGHIGTIYAGGDLIIRGEPVTDTQLLVIAALYLAGGVLGIHESRQRKLART